MKTKNYNLTKIAVYIGFVSQATVVCFAPLLYLLFNETYHVTLGQIAAIPTLFFLVQLFIDLFCSVFADKIGYRTCIVAAELCTSVGLIGLAFLPDLFATPFVGILISTVVYAVGSGLTEALSSPIVEACPFPNKDAVISNMSAVYCFGCVGTILLSSLFFTVFGIENWKYLALVWALIPAVNVFFFAKCPMEPVVLPEEKMPLKKLLGSVAFWAFLGMMACAGATEHSILQWASAYAEQALGVSKSIGDIAGPCAFALAEGAGRVLYSRFGTKRKLSSIMLLCSGLCLVCYLGMTFFALPALGFAFCILCGLSVGMLWPGTINAAAKRFPVGGTAMFAILAMVGDLGCSAGPGLVGTVADRFGESLRYGIGAACIFPVLFFAIVFLRRKKM